MYNTTILRVVDLDDMNNRADFILNKKRDEFILHTSTFKEDKRKYQMLHYLERNKEILLEELEWLKSQEDDETDWFSN